LEVIIAMLLLSILMTSIAFGGTSVLLAVKNRTENVSKYALAMNKAQALVISKGESFANSATFNVTNNVISYHNFEAVTGTNGFTLKTASIDFKKELNDAGVSNVAVAVTTSTTDPNIVVVNLSTVDKTGRRYENTVILRKLINAAPLLPKKLRCSFETPTTCSVPLLFPAVSFFPTTATTTTGSVFSGSTFSTATYSLKGASDYDESLTIYKYLEIETSTSATLVQIPKMKGLDSTVSNELWVKVE